MNKPAREDRFPLVQALESHVTGDAAFIVLMAAIGGFFAIMQDERCIEKAERFIFNIDVFLYCKYTLCIDEITELINYGMQLEDVLEALGVDSLRDACKKDLLDAERLLRTVKGGL